MEPNFSCRDCGRHADRGAHYVLGRGPRGADIAIINDAPLAADADYGVPFAGQAGDNLDRALDAVGLHRDRVFVTSLVRCAGAHLDTGDAQTCFRHLNQEITYVNPKVVVLMGHQPATLFLGPDYAQRGLIQDASGAKTPFVFSPHPTNLKKFVVAPNILNTFVHESEYRDLVRALGFAVATAAGKTPAVRTFGYTEEKVFFMITKATQECQEPGAVHMAFHVSHTTDPVFPRLSRPGSAQLQALAWSLRPYEAHAVLLNKKTMSDRVIWALRALMDTEATKASHDGKRGIQVLRRAGIWGPQNILDFDTAVADYARTQKPARALLTLVAEMRPDLYNWNSNQGTDDTRLEICAQHADAVSTLWQHQAKALVAEQKTKLFEVILMPHYREAIDIELHGICFDVEGARELGQKYIDELRTLEIACCAHAQSRHPHWWVPQELAAEGIAREKFRPLNLSSNEAVADIIYNEFKLLPPPDEGGKMSVDADTLKPIMGNSLFVQGLLAFRTKLKYLSTYLGLAWPPQKQTREIDLFGEAKTSLGLSAGGGSPLHWVDTEGRIHPEIHIDGTEPGRVTCTDPAIQVQANLKEIRDLIIPRPGYVFLDADFRALELRILGILSGEPELKRIFDAGWDPHSVTASKIFGIPIELAADATKADRDAYFKQWNQLHADKRVAAKKVNFGIPYGQTCYGLAKELGTTPEVAQRWLDGWDREFPVASRWLAANVERARRDGGIHYGFQRFRGLPGFGSTDQGIRHLAERQAKNTPMQGIGGDCLSVAIARIHSEFRKAWGAGWSDVGCVVMEVHDQLVVEVRADRQREAHAIILDAMTTRMPFLGADIPLEVDIKAKSKWGTQIPVLTTANNLLSSVG